MNATNENRTLLVSINVHKQWHLFIVNSTTNLTRIFFPVAEQRSRRGYNKIIWSVCYSDKRYLPIQQSLHILRSILGMSEHEI